MRKLKRITLICQNPECGKEFEVTPSQANRKYCCQKCQIPWLKGKKGIQSEESRKKRSESLKKYYQTKDGKEKRNRLTERNLQSDNPWRKGNYTEEWKEACYDKVRETYKDPEVRKKCAWNTGMKLQPGVIDKMSKKRIDWWADKDEEYRRAYGKKISKIKKRDYASGKLKIRTGKDASNWKGGYSSIINLIYSHKKLYVEWKYKILSRDKFRCIKCGSGECLNVHHNEEKMSDIYYKITENIDITELDFDGKMNLVEQIIDYHIDNDVSGITLCKKCHKKEHPSYNF